eukprot:COSAG02_NODE_49783_length_324_cov_1.604444_1_plen_58_part_10
MAREPYLSETQRAYQRNRSALDCLLVNTLTQLRAKACKFIMLRNGTDLEGAFDTASHV